MANYPTKVLANVGNQSASSAGNSGYSGKYYSFTYTVSGTSAAVTALPIGVAPTACKYVGCSFAYGAGTAGTLTVTATPLKIPYDAGTTTVTLNTTAPVLGTGVVAFPAFTQTINFDGAGAVTTSGSNNTTTTTGITAAVLKTDSTVQFRQGDLVGITTAGTFTGSGNLCITVWLQEWNGQY